MASKLFPTTKATLLLLLVLLSRPPTSLSWDNSPPVCPYPCLPPPTSVTNCPPPPPSTPNPPTAVYPPPPPSTPEYWNYPPPAPSGYWPFNPAPPYINIPAPPPPNPILPYFPWYYKTPPSKAPPLASNVLGGFLVAWLIMALNLALF